MIARGSGVARVERTGARTAVGELGASLAAIKGEPSPLQKRTGELVVKLGFFALSFCSIVIVAYGLVHGDWFEGAISGITLAIGLLPEEFPMVLAIFLAIGAFRLAGRNVLVRRSSVTETLGSTSMLCVDKTGTLTQNRMRVAALATDSGLRSPHGEARKIGPDAPPADDEAALLRAALRASSQNPVDPMDRAMHAIATDAGVGAEGAPTESFPIRPDLLAFIQGWRVEGGALYAAKGAPEAIFSLTHADDDTRARYHAAIDEVAQRGLRVLAVAQTPALEALPAPEAAPFALLGLLAFEDPIRDDVSAAVALARRAGVAVTMITGDYPATALSIAREAGIDTSGGVMTGAEIVATHSR